ncbi:MAG: HEPN domain-containing protein [Deltaproteobacteria bacterium]|nr:HEPN domain-containing protein [Deltaproteobacteria bacterium]
MTDTGREEVVREEVARAEEELRAAAALLTAGIPRVAVTRAYFAVFHMARAVLYAAGYEPRTHEGVLHLLSLHFVKPGKLAVAHGRVLARLHKYRGEADYGDSFVIDEPAAAEDLVAARDLCERLRALLPDESNRRE